MDVTHELGVSVGCFEKFPETGSHKTSWKLMMLMRKLGYSHFGSSLSPLLEPQLSPVGDLVLVVRARKAAPLGRLRLSCG